MTLYYDDNRGTDQFSLQDFEPSSGAKLGAAVSEVWLESYGPVARDFVQSKIAGDQPRLSAAEAADRIKSTGLKVDLTPRDGQYTGSQLDVILERQRELAKVRDIRERTPWSIGSPVRGLAMFGAGILDPINLATAFVPWTRAIPAAQGLRAAALSSSFGTRTAGRAGFGAVDAGISTAVLEPFYYGMRQSLGDDYDAVDSMINIGFGTAFGGGVHSLGGAGVDAFRRATGRALPSDAYVGLSVDEIQLVEGLKSEINSGMDARDVQRVLETYTPEMRRAAGFPDADDSLDVVVPPPGMLTGNPARVKIGNDYEPAEWAVVDADQLSATVDKADNQFRDRNRAAYQAEIQARANAIDPAQVLSADNPLMDVGPPTIAVDGTIIGGNGRTLFIQRAYEIGKGNDYRDALIARLEALGLDPAEVANMKKPVLVRRLTRKVDVKRAAMLSNEGGSSVMSPLEQAKVDAERLSGSRLEPDADGGLDTAANRAAIRRWVDQQPENQRNALMTEDGLLSASGLARLRNAVLFQAYGDSPTLARLIEATDVGSRNVASALARTAGVVADAEASIARGELHPLSLAGDIRMAVEQFDNLRRAGTKVADYLAQVDAFGDPLTPEARLLLDAIGRYTSSSRRIGDVIAGYYDRLQEAGNPGQGDMFGAGAPDRLALLDAAIRAVDNTVDNAAEMTAAVSGETREAVLRTAVAQSVDGRVIDVDAVMNTDEALGATAGVREINDAASRNSRPEALRTADFDASAAVDERLAAAPKWEGLTDAEAAEAEAAALLADTVKAGDTAFKYSRGEGPGQKKATLWQGSTARFSPEDGAPLGRFRWDFINSEGGEQAQAFGYGHYLAQQAWISQTMYRERLINRRAGGSEYTIPDGVGGVMTLSRRDNDAAYVMPDGTIVHLSQKNPQMAALARAAAQVDSYGYAKSRQTFESLLRMEREALGEAQDNLNKALSENATADAGLASVGLRIEVDGANQRLVDADGVFVATDDGLASGAGYRKATAAETDAIEKARAKWPQQNIDMWTRRASELEARVAEEEANLAALDEVTVDADGQRTLAPGIQKYDPPQPANLRDRATVDGQEIALSQEALRMLRNTAGLGSELAQTIGRDLDVRVDRITGSNALAAIDDLLSSIDEASYPEVFAELRALQGRGINEVTIERPGSLYRAEMSGADFQSLMLWDEPLSAQPEKVREAFERFGIYKGDPQVVEKSGRWVVVDGEGKVLTPYFINKEDAEARVGTGMLTGKAAYHDLIALIDGDDANDELLDAIMDAHHEIARRRFGSRADDVTDAIEIMEDAGYVPRSDEVASVILNEAGIPGHAFLDGNSRNAAADQAGYNIVIYSDDVAKIVDRYARQTGEIGRATDTVEGLTEALRLSFGRSTEKLLESGRIRVVATPDDIPGGPHPADVKAATTPNSTVYVVAQNVTELEARSIVLHEVGVHVGMEGLLGPKLFNELLGEVDAAIARGESWAQAARSAVPSDTPARYVREEQLAYLVQNSPELPIVQRIMAAIRAWVYRNFEFARDRMELTEADYRMMAVAALHHASRHRRKFGGIDLAYGRAGGAADQTQTAEFRRWFNGSQVVDADGQPMVVYRGSSADEGNVITRGWFTSSPEAASMFAGKMRDIDSPPSSVVAPAYVSLKRPLVIDAAGADWDRITWGDPRDGQRLTTDQIASFARDEGYDGVIIRNVDETDDMVDVGVIDVFVAFEPTQIKSATGNVGTFDPTNPDIRYSRGETPDTKTEADAELKRYDEAVKRAKGYAGVLRAAADKLDNDAMATAAMRAAMPDITPVEIDDLLAQLRRQVQGLRGMARSARTMLGAEDQAGALQSEAMRAADMLANNLQMAAVIEKRNAALNMNVRLKASSFVNQFRDKGLDFEGFAALLVGSERVRTGSRVSVDAEYKGFRGEWVGGMIADVERMGLMREFISGEFDRDIYDALYRMGMGEKADLSNLPKQAVQLAEVVSKYQEDARNTRNRFGSWIRDLSGYITRQSHDMYKIREVSDADWIAFVKERVDLPKMMRLGLISESDPISSLRGMYDDFASGVHMKAVSGEEDGAAFGRGSNLAKRESVSRAIYFKDGLAAYEYNERFGTGRLAESVLFGLDQAARSTSLLKTLGTNPEATLTRLMDEYEATLAATPERRAKFREQRGALLDMLAQVDGSVNVPGNLTAAKVGSFLRSWQSMAKLGGALISSFSDLAGYGAELRYSQGKGLLSGVADGMARVMQGRAKDERAAIASSLGVFHESMAGAITARFDSPDLVGGKMAAAMQAFFRLNGLTWWTETLRDGAALSHSHYMATQAGRAFDKIDPEFQRMLQLYNIDAGKWDLLRMGQLQMADGRGYLTPEGLRTVPRAAFENYIQQVGRTVNDATVQNLIDDLSQALRVMTIDRAHHAVLEPSARTRAWMLRGTKPGTVPGEFLRYVGQFKSFSVAMVQSTLGREVYGRGYDSVGEYLKNGRGDMVGLAYMVGLYGLLGYGAMAAKDMLKGRTPRDPLDPRTMAAAMAQGGGLGLYGDFLFGEYSRMGRTFTASLAGPVIGNLDTLTDLWTRIRNGDDVAAASFKALIDNTPFLNLYWARPTLDYLVLYHIQEALNPGFLRRMEKRIERENGQSFVLPPSQVVR